MSVASHTPPPADAASDPPWVAWQGAGARWQVRPAWRHRLLGPQGLPLARWLHSGQAQVVKQGQHRTVYRIDLAGETVYLKHYHPPDRWATWRSWWRPAARREAARATALAAQGIATALPLATGQSRAGWLPGGEQFLITAAIPQTSALDVFLARDLRGLPLPAQRAVGRQLTVALARWCAELHAAGVRHNDLHLGNILVQHQGGELLPGADSQPRLYLIDVPGIRLGRPLGWPATRDNLVMLLSGAHSVTTAGQRLRFWREYLERRGDLEIPSSRAALLDLEQRRRRYARRLLRSRDKRAWRTNRDFHGLQLTEGRGQAVSKVSPADLAALVARPEVLLASGWGSPLKLSHSSRVVRTRWNLAQGPIDVVVKRWSAKRGWSRFWARFGRSRAAWAWQAGHALLARGIDTPRPWAVALPAGRSGGEAYLVTEWLPGAVNLHEHLWRLAALAEPSRRRQADICARELGRVIGRMHDWQISHRDLKGANLAIQTEGQNCRVWVLDTDGIRIGRTLSRRQQVANLARLGVGLAAHPWVGRTTLARFWRSYARALRLPRIEARSLARATLGEIDRQIARRREQGRPIW